MREESFLPQSFLFRVAWSTSLGRPLNTDENGLSYYIITIQITIRKSLLSSLDKVLTITVPFNVLLLPMVLY